MVLGVPGRKPAVLLVQFIAEPGHHDVVMAEIQGVFGGSEKGLLRQFVKHPDRVVDTLGPCLRIELLEDHLHGRVPAPPEIVRQIDKPGNSLRDMRKTFSDRVHHS